MRILLTADFYPPAPGGLEAHVRRLAHALVATGHEVTVVAGGGPAAPVDDEGVVVHRAPSSLTRLPGAFQDPRHAFHPPWPDAAFRTVLGRVAARFAPDVVHAHGSCAFSAAAVCADRWPLVVTLHDYGLRCPKKTLLRGGVECADGPGLRCLACPGTEQGTVKRAGLALAVRRSAPRLAGQVARFIAVSEHVARRHLETGSRWPGIDPERVTVIPNFLDLPRQPYRTPIGSDVLYVGPATRHKGLPVLLDAFQRLPAGLARLVVVGADGSADGVEFAGRLDGEPLWQQFRTAAMLVVPSVWPEPCPTVALEAMAWGRPVVASRTGGLTDLVIDGGTGLLVPPGDAGALAAAIASLLTDRARLKRVARAAWDRSPSFGAAAVVARIEAEYAAVLAGAHR